MKSKSVFLYGYYGFDNFGDELLLRSICEYIFKVQPNLKINVRSFGKISIADSRLESTCVDKVLSSSNNWITKSILYINSILRWATRSDELWIGGGGLFLDKGRFNIHLLFLYILCLYFSKIKRAPIYIFGVSLDPLSTFSSLWLCRNILKLANFVGVRDPLSTNYANKISKREIAETEDLIFASDFINSPLPRSEKTHVGLSFVDYYGGYKIKTGEDMKFDNSLKDYISSFPKETRFKYFIFQSQLGLNDQKYLKKIEGWGYNIEPVYCTDWKEFLDHLSRCFKIVSMRFHLALIAIRYKIPTLIIDHELKLKALAKMYNASSITLESFIKNGLRENNLDESSIHFELERSKKFSEDNFLWIHKE